MIIERTDSMLLPSMRQVLGQYATQESIRIHESNLFQRLVLGICMVEDRTAQVGA